MNHTLEANHRKSYSLKGFISLHREAILLISLISILAIFHAWSLGKYPMPGGDEVWFGSRSWELLHKGMPFSSLDSGVTDRFPDYEFIHQLLPAAIQAIAFIPFDTPQLLPIRVMSLIFGMVLLFCIYYIARYFCNSRIALLSVFLTGISLPFMWSAHSARPDIYCAALGYLSISLYLFQRSRTNRIWCFLIGLLPGLAFEIHPNSAIFYFPLLGLFLLDFKNKQTSPKKFLLFIFGGIASIIFYLSIHVLRNPLSYLQITHVLFTATHTPPLLTLSLPAIGDSAFTTLIMLLKYMPYTIPLLVFSIGILFLDRERNIRPLILILLTLVLGVVLIINQKLSYYLILYSPAFDILLAILLARFLIFRNISKIKLVASSVLLAIFALTYYTSVFAKVDFHEGDTYRSVYSRISEAIPGSKTIMGSQQFWFPLYKHQVYSWETLIHYQHFAPGTNLEDAFKEIHPDILIVDNLWRNFIFDIEVSNQYLIALNISYMEMESILTRYGEEILEIEDPYLGNISVYRMDWSK